MKIRSTSMMTSHFFESHKKYLCISLFFFLLLSSSTNINSQCSSGCGSGYTTRNVTCTNGHIESPSECTQPRPIKYKQCENKAHCRWRYGKWKNCTCAGYQKRRITCWDGYKNKAATNCPEEDKPASRQRCIAPPNCMCLKDC